MLTLWLHDFTITARVFLGLVDMTGELKSLSAAIVPALHKQEDNKTNDPEVLFLIPALNTKLAERRFLIQ